jgi:16S rRNA (guanine966-N2)-methyltransferase
VADTQGLRPTPDRVRETLFNWLQATIHGANCLDLFAGSGALGIEAVSRGAASSVLIEQDRKTAETLRESIEMLDADEIVVHQADALQWIKAADQVFDIIFLDPPFGKNMIEQSLSLLTDSKCVGEQTLIYVESESVWQAENNVEVIKQAKAGQVHYMLLKTVAE